MTEKLSLNTIEQLQAIAHPLRQKLLEQFSLGPATTKQVATALGLQPTRLYHHVAKLESAGLIKLVETKPVRGATEKYYAMTATVIEIDHDALPEATGKVLGNAMSVNVIDSLWTNIRKDITEFLGKADAADGAAQKIMFVQGEFEIDDETAEELRQTMVELLQTYEKKARQAAAADTGRPRSQYRAVLGCYPKP